MRFKVEGVYIIDTESDERILCLNNKEAEGRCSVLNTMDKIKKNQDRIEKDRIEHNKKIIRRIK